MINTDKPLAAGAEFVGNWINAHNTSSIAVSALTDQNSDLSVDFSVNGGADVDDTKTFKVEANKAESHRITITRQYFRLRIKNTSLTLQTFLRADIILAHQADISQPYNTAIQQDADAKTVRSFPAELDIAQNKYEGYSIENGFGVNTSVPMGGGVDIWGGDDLYKGFPAATVETVSVSSSDANDTAAGSGAQAVQVFGLSDVGNPQDETVILDGVTPVATVNTYSRVNRTVVVASGDGNMAFNAGVITTTHSATVANIFSIIPIGINVSRDAVFTVPKGFTAYVRKLIVHVDEMTTAAVSGGVYVSPPGFAPRIVRPYSASSNGRISSDIIYGGIPMPELTDAAMRILDCSANNTVVISNFDLLLVKQ